MSPLDDQPITAGPTAVVKYCVCACACWLVVVCVCLRDVSAGLVTFGVSQGAGG